MQTLKMIQFESGEDCKIDIDILSEHLSKLPVDMYMELYNKMHMKIYGYPPISNFGGGCFGEIEEKKAEIKVETDFSEVQDAMEVAEKLHIKLNEVNRLISEIAGRRVSAIATIED